MVGVWLSRNASTRVVAYLQIFSAGPPRISAVFGGNAYFTAEALRYAEERREEHLVATLRPCISVPLR
jgi:hypothetical protein